MSYLENFRNFLKTEDLFELPPNETCTRDVFIQILLL